MKRPEKTSITEPDSKPSYPWIEAALCAKDPTVFLMGLSEIEFAALLAELEAKRLSAGVTPAPGRQCRNGRLKGNRIERSV